MQDLFPRAKGVVWNGQEPQILPSDSPYDKEFHGFITQEEIYMIVKHAQNPKLVSGIIPRSLALFISRFS